MQGYGDPFCRAAFPWDNIDDDLLRFYKALGAIRRQSNVFCSGEFIPVYANFGEIAYIRKKGESQLLIAASRWHEHTQIKVPKEFKNAKCLLGISNKGETLNLPPYGFSVLQI